MKKSISLICAFAMVLTMSGCQSKAADGSASTNYSNSTITGKVTAIDGTSVTLQLGEMAGMDGNNMPEGGKPDGTTTMDLSSATITIQSRDGSTEGSVSDIAVDDILMIEVGDNNTAKTVTVQSMPNMDKMKNQE